MPRVLVLLFSCSPVICGDIVALLFYVVAVFSTYFAIGDFLGFHMPEELHNSDSNYECCFSTKTYGSESTLPTRSFAK